MQLNPEKTALRLNISTTFSTAEVEELIGMLADMRAQMEPAVPDTRPDPGTGALLVIQDDPSFFLASTRDGGIRIWLRSHGLGWLGFSLPVRTAQAMQGFLTRHVEASTGDLFGNGDGNVDSTH
jgi:hypothetical protein